MLVTIPFHSNNGVSATRATLKGGKLTYLLPLVRQGDPVSKDGAFFFTDFGWDMLVL